MKESSDTRVLPSTPVDRLRLYGVFFFFFAGAFFLTGAFLLGLALGVGVTFFVVLALGVGVGLFVAAVAGEAVIAKPSARASASFLDLIIAGHPI